MEYMVEHTEQNFILALIKYGFAYPVVLTGEQKEMFNILLPIALQGTVKIGKEPIGKVVTVSEHKKMKERNNL